ncbi:ACT domain-containing protein [Nocardioides sp.]|uniref:ACT domain-containing protein n=1 Tax=Nocardioides sp. TaxID=35761 RepID=UPI002734011B|nr:ACT domain-containing protein [Nocardioides sp.]MDP3892291.1 ACT domain-containing protein [Nocardioides sp.]
MNDQPTADQPTADQSVHTLERFPETLAVVRLGPGAEVPDWAESSSLFSVTATATETSLVCASRSVPTKARHHKPLTAFAVQGTLDLTASGVLHGLLGPLADEGISVFTISTFDTDWLLVPKAEADRAAEAWRRQGHTVAPAVPVTPRGKKK